MQQHLVCRDFNLPPPKSLPPIHLCTNLIAESKEAKDLLNLLEPLGKDGVALGTPFRCAPLLQVVVDSLQPVPGQQLAGTQPGHQVVEDVEVFLSPVEVI